MLPEECKILDNSGNHLLCVAPLDSRNSFRFSIAGLAFIVPRKLWECPCLQVAPAFRGNWKITLSVSKVPEPDILDLLLAGVGLLGLLMVMRKL